MNFGSGQEGFDLHITSIGRARISTKGLGNIGAPEKAFIADQIIAIRVSRKRIKAELLY